MPQHYLNSFFNPDSVVLIGATHVNAKKQKTIDAILLNNLQHDFKGKLFVVNPKLKGSATENTYKKISQLPSEIDLAIVVSSSKSISKVITECGKAGIKNVLLMTYYEDDKPELSQKQRNDILKAAQKYDVRVLGPGAAGLIRTDIGLNASYINNTIHRGSLALVTRSKSISSTILDWADKNRVGFSTVIGYGVESDLCLSDILEFLVDDYRTSSIILHLDAVHDARRFMSALKAAATHKPVVILKSDHDVGRYTDAIFKTGDIRSMDAVFHAAVSRAGADRVYTLASLFAAAKILSIKQKIKGTKLAIISNGNAPIMLAQDRMRRVNIKVPVVSSSLKTTLSKNKRIKKVKENAVLIRNDHKTAETFADCSKQILESAEFDALAIVFSPDILTQSEQVAQTIINAVKQSSIPILAVWLGDSSIESGRQLLSEHNISNYRTPEAAIDAFTYLCTHYRNRQNLLQIPYPLNKSQVPDIQRAREIIERNLQNKRRVLSQIDSRFLLEYFRINCTPSRHANNLHQAQHYAELLGYPVALKIDSPNITYKSDVDGVRLNIQNAEALHHEYESMMQRIKKMRPNAEIDGVIVERMYAPQNGRELMIRIINDPAFGPVISFGAGGTQSPDLRDRALQLPPLNRRLAENLINSTRVSYTLKRFRNLPHANFAELRNVLIRVSDIACELPEVFELTINPLVLDENSAVVNDANIVIRKTKPQKKKYSHLAIHPYPSDWSRKLTLKNNIQVDIRPLRAEDALAEAEFVNKLSSKSKYYRFMHALNQLTPEMLSKFTKMDYDREMAFAAFIKDVDSQGDGNEEILGVSRYSINPDHKSCEFAIVVADDWQGMGLARQLMLILIEHVKQNDLNVIEGTVLKHNVSMDKLMSALGFEKKPSPDDYEINIYRRVIN